MAMHQQLRPEKVFTEGSTTVPCVGDILTQSENMKERVATASLPRVCLGDSKASVAKSELGCGQSQLPCKLGVKEVTPPQP